MSPIRTLAGQAWFDDPAVGAIYDLLDGAEGKARIVGGAVRNALIGMPVADIDFATVHRPESVMKRARKAGFKAIPTGIEHGTITIVAEGRPFEVTSLRRDVETDGRRAVVAFTEDWAEDARRRDFTMNALYLNADGTVFDPLGGLGDLEARHVRFIGSAVDRIREDYLRILRFFRMHAWYGVGPLDADGLKAVTAERAGLARLSAERVGRELLRLLAARDPRPALDAMAVAGILNDVLGLGGNREALAALIAIENAQGLSPDAVLRLGVLADSADLGERLRLSRAESGRIVALARAALPADEKAMRRSIVDEGGDRALDLLLAAWARADVPPDDAALSGFLRLAREWEPPDFPVNGHDAHDAGITDGPSTGRALAAARAAWIESGYAASRDELLAVIAAWKSEHA